VATRSLLSTGLPSTEYYAPSFRVEVEGEELDPVTIGDILEVKVAMDMQNLTRFDLTVSNNWDHTRSEFKYSDKKIFDVGNRVHVMMGYTSKLVSMVNGQISSMSPRFPDSGASVLTVSGLDGMFKLRGRKPAGGELTKYVSKTDWQIAEIIASRNGLRVSVTKEGETHDEVVQKNQDDAQFLVERAKRIDFDCYVLTDPNTGEATLHFVKPTDCRDGRPIRVFQFTWGQNLISFHPTINLSSQVAKVTVRGWNPATKRAIVAAATADDLPGGGDGSGPQLAQQSLSNKQDVVVDAPVTSFQEARELAISRLRELAYEFITGTGEVIGLPELRLGDNIELSGLGKRFSKKYYVRKVTHTLGDAGYRTQFEVRQSCTEATIP
jgi:phage protein D